MRFKFLILWVGVFLAHAAAQFVAWSAADSSRANAQFALAVANALMFPTFSLAGQLADRWFWTTFVVNSALWASAGTWLFRRLGARGRPAPT